MAIDFIIGTDYKTDTGLKVTCIFIGLKFATFVTPEGQALNVPLGDDSVLQPIGQDAKSIVGEFKQGTQHYGYVGVHKDTGFDDTVFKTLEEAQQGNASAFAYAELFFDQDTGKLSAEYITPGAPK